MNTVDLDTNLIKNRINDLDSFIDKIQCSNHETVLKAPSKIVALGDIHGDFEALIYCLYGAGVIDSFGRWIGRDTIVVQTGDLIDDCRHDESKSSKCYNEFPVNGYDELIILDYLSDLNIQANKVGGKVVLCMGNHEFMAIINDSHSRNYQQRKTREYYNDKRNSLMKPGSPLAKKLACLLNVVVFVGDWVFLHGGLRPSSFDNLQDIKIVNLLMKLYMSGELMPTDASKFLETIDNHWFFYDRDYSQNMIEDDNGILCNEFIQIRRMLGKPNLRMVVGHSPQHIINSVCKIDGKPAVYRVDTSMSRAFGHKSHPSMRINALIIENDRVYSVTPMNYGMKFRIPHSDEYFQYAHKNRLSISNPKPYKSVKSKSERRMEQIASREAYLETQEDLDADEAFIYYDNESI